MVIWEEIASDLASNLAEVSDAFSIREKLFPASLAAFDDPVRHRIWAAGRGAAKTTTVQWSAILAALTTDECSVLYVSDTKERAKTVAWDDLVKWSADFGGDPNINERTITFPNHSKIYVTGADSKKIFNRKRGIKRIKLVIFDEAQDWLDEILEYAITKVFMPRLGDLEAKHGIKGRIIVAGTGTRKDSYFAQLFFRAQKGEAEDWSAKTWTQWDNPHIADPDGEFKSACEAAGVEFVDLSEAPIPSAFQDGRSRRVDSPDELTRREWFAEFNKGGSLQILRVPDVHVVPTEEFQKILKRLTHFVLAVDFGTIDACAVVVWGWCESINRIFLVRVAKDVGLAGSEQVRFARSVVAEFSGRGLIAIVGDPGGGGKGLIKDIQKGENFYEVEAAEKSDKVPALRLWGADLKTGFCAIPEHEKEMISAMERPEWKPDADSQLGVKVRGHMPDEVDAGLYGWRRAKEFFVYREPGPELTPEQQRELRYAEEYARRREKEENPWSCS